MPSDIFLFPAIWLAAGAGSFLRYLDRGPKELFLATNWGAKTIFKLKTLPKNWTIYAIDTKDSKIQWIYFNGLSAKPEMYVSPNKMQKNKYKHRKNTGQCYMFWFKCSTYIQLFFENIRININSTTYNLTSLIKHKI